MNDNNVETVRENYDRLAREYANRIFDELQHKPLDRELLDRFAAQLRGHGEVCDLGCGPGHVARYLRDANLPVFGLDLSPGMLQQARRLNPDIPFREGDMSALNIPTGTLAGISAFYAIVNIPKESLALAFREMSRVLKPGGLLLIAFHVGDDVVRPDELWDIPVAMAFFHFKTAEILQGLEMAGFAINEVIERNAYPDVEYQSRRAYVLARKPELPPEFPSL
jgi:ubiquinone/menaquinone biosynthesis C-methylase UbiE